MSIATTTDLLALLRTHRLLDPARLVEVEGPISRQFPVPRALARELVRRGWLTGYQVNQLFQGNGRGLTLGSYVLLDKLGEGGMGAVFKAHHWKLGRTVALKLIRKERLDNETAIKRFHREILAAAQVDHPNIVRAYDADEAGGTHFFLMEYVEGTDLANVVKERGPLTVAQACDYIRQAALGLQHAFERGLVHRDIKPANLLLTTKGVVKLLDMGLARMHMHVASGEMVSTLTQEGSVMGTPDYIAPEQAMRAHEADIRADLYSLGCTLYFLLTGKVPFPGGSLTEKLLKHQMDPVPDVRRLRPDVPQPVAGVVARLMAKRPEDRYQTPAELAAALDEALRGKTVPAPAAASRRGQTRPAETDNPFAGIDVPTANVSTAPTALDQPHPSRLRPRRPLVAVVGGGVLLAAVVFLVIWLVSHKPPDSEAGANDTRPEGETTRRDRPGEDKRTIMVFNGKDFTGWRPHKTNEIKGWIVGTASFDSSKPGAQAQPGGTELINVTTGSCLVTTREFGECVIEVEVLVGRGTNSGIYVMGEYEIQILDTFGKTVQGPTDMGALFGVAAPRVNACKPAGEWQTLLIDFRALRFQGNRKIANAKLVRVLLNGQLIHENVDVPGVCPDGLTGVEHPTGPILLQGDYGGGVAFRNFRVTEGTLLANSAAEAKKQQEEAAQQLGVPVQITNSIGMKLNLIPPGRFLMGSPENEPGHQANEAPRHEVEISRPFYLGVHEVTVGQFKPFVAATGYRTEAERNGTGSYCESPNKRGQDPKVTWRAPAFEQTDDHPVVCISWNDANAFCDWLSEKEKKHYALPTEAQWEYACRAGSSTTFSFGDDAAELARYAWYRDNSGNTTHPVGQLQANAWGIHDMHGNAWEWCADWLGDDTFRNSPSRDPRGPTAGGSRVFRGGGYQYIDDAARCRAPYRNGHVPSMSHTGIGFRVVCEVTASREP